MSSAIPPKTPEILVQAQSVLIELGYQSGPVDVMRMLDLCFRKFGLCYDIVEHLVDHLGVPQDACLSCGLEPILTLTDRTYEGCLGGHPADRFTVAHEIGHFFRHKDEFSNSKRLHRGQPGSGTSFKTNPLQESEANAFAGGFLLPLSEITKETKRDEASALFKMSKQATEFALMRARAAFPEKWSPGK